MEEEVDQGRRRPDQQGSQAGEEHGATSDEGLLEVLGVGADYIKDVLRQLTMGRSAWVPNVSISEKVLRNAGFVSIGNLARSN